jgi:predicted small secreted protein
MKISMFKPYSLGVVAENKDLKGKSLKVSPVETLPFMDGEVSSTPTPAQYKGVDEAGQVYQGKTITDNVLVATWLPDGSNRTTAPNMRRGERVMLYQIDGVDKYYWKELGLDDHLRKLETVIYAFSGNPNEGSDELNPETCYFLEISTHMKKVTFQTSKANGEPFSYKFEFDTATGNVELDDDIGNKIHLDSTNHYLEFKNVEGSWIELDKNDIRITAPKKIHVKAGSEILFECGATTLSLKPGGTTLKTPKFDGSP